MALDPGIIISTSPSESIYSSLDISDRCVVKNLRSRSNDVRIENWFADETILKKSKRRSFSVMCDQLTVAEIEQLERWDHNRTLLRILGNYGPNTIFYQSFQRAHGSLYTTGAQIGDVGVFGRAMSGSGGTRICCMYDIDKNQLVQFADDVPRYRQFGADNLWGIDGLLLESETQVAQTRSYPESGTELWVDSVSGLPTGSFTTDAKPNIIGVDSVYYVVQTSGANDLWYPSISTGTFSANCSVSLWVMGQGIVQLEAYDVTGAATITTSNQILQNNTWTKIIIENIDLTGVSALRLKLRALTDSIVYIGNVNVQNVARPNEDIYCTPNSSAKGYDSLLISALKGLTNAATFTFAIEWPRWEVPGKHWLLNNSQDMELWLENTGTAPISGKLFFQKKNASYKAEYTGMDALIEAPELTGIIGAGYSDSNIKLWVNGAMVDQNGSYNALHTQTGSVYVGSDANEGAWNAPIAWMRVDDTLLSDAEQLEIANIYINPERRVWALRNEGREFVIDRKPSNIVVTPDRYRSTFVLREVRSEATATTEVK